MRVWFAIALVGCYSPDLKPCGIRCESDAQCLGNGICVEGVCRNNGDDTDCKIHQVTVRTDGPGMVTIDGEPPLTCLGTCSFQLKGTQTFSAVPDDGARVTRWNLDGCKADTTCVVDVTDDMEIVVSFNTARTLKVKFQGNGEGLVKGVTDDALVGSFECFEDPCKMLLEPDTTVSLTMTPAFPAVGTWTDACESTAVSDPCTLLIRDDTTAGVQNDVKKVTVLLAPSNGGTVTIEGQVCPPDCDFSFAPSDTGQHALVAATSPGFAFSRWVMLPAEDCDGDTTLSCPTTLSNDGIVIALFDAFTITVDLIGSPVGAVNIRASDLDIDISCVAGTSCTTPPIPPGKQVTLMAVIPVGGLIMFDRWNTCPTLSADKMMTCGFAMPASDVRVVPTFN